MNIYVVNKFVKYKKNNSFYGYSVAGYYDEDKAKGVVETNNKESLKCREYFQASHILDETEIPLIWFEVSEVML